MPAGHHAYVEAVRTDGEAALAAIGSAPSAAVPSCPGWDAVTLGLHLGRLWRYVSRQARSPEQLDDSGRPDDGEDPLVWAADGLAALLLTLTETDPRADAWNWTRSEPKTAAFWFRRMAQETAMHRWDAENAAGEPAPITSWLAADGIDEVATMWLPRRRGRSKGDPTEISAGTAHLHAADPSPGQPSEWFLEFGAAGQVKCRYVHEKGDAVLRGTASDMLLRLWRRPSAAEEFGDETVLAALHAE